ncbi:MAG: zinc transporter ZupT [Patescibacteria group bacterium]
MNFHQIWIPLLLSTFAGLCTVLGSIIIFSFKKDSENKLNYFLGMSAGVMIYVSLVELLGGAINDIGFNKANLAFFGGIAFIFLIDYFIPHEYIAEKVCYNLSSKDKKLFTAGVLLALGIAIHNFPEGIAVAVGSLENISLGLSLAVAIAIHNIPEGIAVAMPIYCATKNRTKAVLASFFAGIAEPIGAAIGLLVLMPFLNQEVLDLSLSFVAGIMIFISFDELLPLSFKGNKSHISVAGIFTGMAIMAVSLYLL